ncbi:DNA topology modulation protein [Lactovum odontotermitis]
MGNTASGKSTLAGNIARTLDLPQYSLDKFYWQANWKHISRPEFLKIMTQLTQKESWVIDGTFAEFGLESRFEAADKILLLDSHPFDCVRRALSRRGKDAGRLPEGADDREMNPILAIGFLVEILIFNINDRRRIMKMAKKFPEKFILLKNWDEEDKFIERLEKNENRKI